MVWIIIQIKDNMDKSSLRRVAWVAAVSFPFPGGEIKQVSEKVGEQRSAPRVNTTRGRLRGRVQMFYSGNIERPFTKRQTH